MIPKHRRQPDVRKAPLTSKGRSPRGIALMAALGFLAVLLVGVGVSLHMTSSEIAVQAMQQKEGIAFYAAEAGLSEARSLIRSMWNSTDGFSRVFAQLTAQSANADALQNKGGTDDFGMGGNCDTPAGNPSIPCLYEFMPRQPYTLRENDAQPFFGVTADDSEYYPDHEGVTFHTFIYDDDDGDNTFTQDANRQFWVVSVGEVATGDGRPVRAIVRALVTGPNPLQSDGSYESQKGGGASKTGNF